MPRDFVGRDDLGAPNVASVSRRGAHCAPGGLRAKKLKGRNNIRRALRARGIAAYIVLRNCLSITVYLRPARPHCAQEGDNLTVFPFLRINPFPSGRAARAKVSVPFRLPPIFHIRVSRTAATPEGRARSARPYDRLNGAFPWVESSPSCCF